MQLKQESKSEVVDLVKADGNEVTVEDVKQGTELTVAQEETKMATVKERLKEEMIASGELQRISDTLSIHEPQTIVDFGKQAAEEMGTCADEILRRQDMQILSQTSNMMAVLSKIMDKVDLKEINGEQKGFLGKIIKLTQDKIEKMLAKYNTIGDEIEKVCIELRTYEVQIEQSNKDLANLYENGTKSYNALMKYVLAGEQAEGEIAQYIESLSVNANDPDTQLELSAATQAQQLLSQRVQDLRVAEAVALQSLPIIKSMEFGNLNLSRKINSAFIVTIPVFKNAIAQAILAKRQSLQIQAMKALDEKTDEMLRKNAQMAANNMRDSAMLAGSSAIKVDTVEESWNTIMQGIKDTKAIQEELAKQREQDKIRIERLNNDVEEALKNR